MKTRKSEIRLGDCRKVLRKLATASVDSIVTDPPYELGFMGKAWDGSGIAYNVEVWRECLRVLKPGGQLLAFGGSRTYHRLACAIEDAGFEIRDQIQWIYGSGFPKSLDVSKAIDAAAGAKREVVGYGDVKRSSIVQPFSQGAVGAVDTRAITSPATDAAKQWAGFGTALKPAHEPIVVARKPLSEKTVAKNVLKHGTGGLNVDGCRVGTEVETWPASRSYGTKAKKFNSYDEQEAATQVTGDMPLGRWPANIIHDGSEEVLAGFPESDGQQGDVRGTEPSHTGVNVYGEYGRIATAKRGDSGSAARFFYCAKASKNDRDEGCEGLEEKSPSECLERKVGSAGLKHARAGANHGGARNHHPTVKPTKLMRYLCRLVTPPGGIILDPFMGSGSTGKAAKLEGFSFIGIEKDKDYSKIARKRIRAAA
jgi:hypothetical protein